MNNTFYKRLLASASILGVIGVLMGAFGAHFLKSRLEESDIETLKTGVLYLFIHTLATVLIYSISILHPQSRLLKTSGIAFLTGVILFSGSLFIISTKSLTEIPIAGIGVLTPLGGLCFITGWVSLMLFSLTSKD